MKRTVLVLFISLCMFGCGCGLFSEKYHDEDAKMIYTLNEQVIELDSIVVCRDAMIIILGINIQERDSVLRLRGVDPDTCKWSKYYEVKK